MAVDFNGVKLLLWAKNLGVGFERTLTLGRQGFICSPRRLRRALDDFDTARTQTEVDACFHRPAMGPLYADAFFQLLGAREIVSVDRSDFEGATLLHDLNEPFPEGERSRSDFVFDGGTLEHIFNYPAALRHCLELVRVGGYFLTIAPAHNLMGHGFYQISPELFFRVFGEDSGFTLRKIVLFDCSQTDAEFYSVNDPATTGRRTELTSGRPMFVAALAQRTTTEPPLNFTPQQSDYFSSWAKHRDQETSTATVETNLIGRLRKRLNPYWPYWLRQWRRKWVFHRGGGSPTLRNFRHFRRLEKKELFSERSIVTRP